MDSRIAALGRAEAIPVKVELMVWVSILRDPDLRTVAWNLRRGGYGEGRNTGEHGEIVAGYVRELQGSGHMKPGPVDGDNQYGLTDAGETIARRARRHPVTGEWELVPERR